MAGRPDALRNAVAVQAHIKPQLSPVITAFEALAATDPATQAVYAEREAARYQRVVAVVERLADESLLAIAPSRG